MRAMPLEFPGDPQSWGELAEHQYCFGAELLLAPLYYGFSRIRVVYLPQGSWCDVWSGERFEGGRAIRCRAGPEEIPVFARAGAIIPWLDPSPDTLLPASQKLDPRPHPAPARTEVIAFVSLSEGGYTPGQ